MPHLAEMPTLCNYGKTRILYHDRLNHLCPQARIKNKKPPHKLLFVKILLLLMYFFGKDEYFNTNVYKIIRGQC